jgi:hypothetical protein
MAFYRYASAGETAAVKTAGTPMRVPNYDRHGVPKDVYFTSDYYTSAAKAESALQIGAHHPAGPFSSPTNRLDLDLTGCLYSFNGIVPGGTGTEYVTRDSPLVTAIHGLGP